MARYGRRYGGSRLYHHDDYGHERARQHIEEARRLSVELGGTDKDVKQYFFALPRSQLSEVLDEYEKQYGSAARSYAAATIQKWRSGRVQMGGQTATRLFRLLPPRMPLATKYHLIENLWKQLGPASKKRIRIGLDADIEEVVQTARDHVETVVTTYRIPDQLEKRFTWLSLGDVGIKQDLLNHLRQMERDLAVQSSRTSLPVLMEHVRSDAGQNTQRAAQILQIGKHELELLIDKNAAGVTLEEPAFISESGPDSKNSIKYLSTLAVIAIILLIFLLTRH